MQMRSRRRNVEMPITPEEALYSPESNKYRDDLKKQEDEERKIQFNSICYRIDNGLRVHPDGVILWYKDSCSVKVMEKVSDLYSEKGWYVKYDNFYVEVFAKKPSFMDWLKGKCYIYFGK